MRDIPSSKRVFDLAFTIPLIVVISPIILVIAVLIWLVDGRPILFKQTRPGYHGRLFKNYKFRTMTIRRDTQGNLLPDEQRITRLGNFLRSTSLDELPEFFNVLRGDMSVVGPRPLLVQYLDRYNPEQARRHEVLPGITGWAQVNGRNALSWEDKFRLDVWYVDNWSMRLDVKIIGMTIIQALKREGISQPGHATAEEFMGDQDHG
ncbi:MAG: sugar transferase [Anaerolineales bacterium]|nr:sugar transferase [Anaerolineales bacterium]